MRLVIDYTPGLQTMNKHKSIAKNIVINLILIFLSFLSKLIENNMIRTECKLSAITSSSITCLDRTPIHT